jgi:hypothetical protein
MKIYEGEVEVIETDGEIVKAGGSGGSSTQMSVSPPLRVEVPCVAYKRHYGLVYMLVAIIAAIVLCWNIIRRINKQKKKKSNKKA